MNIALTKIKSIRKTRGLTQAEIADMLFMSQPSYAKIEKGTVSLTLDVLNRIAEIFELPAKWFLDDQADSPETEYQQEDIQHLKQIIEAQSETIKLHIEKVNLFQSMVNNILFDREIEVSQKYLREKSYDELNEHELNNLKRLKIPEKEYGKSHYIEEVTKDRQEIFEEMIDDMTIYQLFKYGLVETTGMGGEYYECWDIYRSKRKPKYKFEEFADGIEISRIEESHL